MKSNMKQTTVKIELPRAWYADEDASVHEFSCAGYLDAEGRFFPHFIHGFTMEERKLIQGPNVSDVLCKELLQKEGYTVHQLEFVRTEGEESFIKVRQRTYTTEAEWEASYKKEAPLLPNNLLPEIGKLPYFKKWIVKLLNEWYGQDVFIGKTKEVEVEPCLALKEQVTGKQVTAEPAKKLKKAFNKALPDPGKGVVSKVQTNASTSIPAFIRVDDANNLLKAHGLHLTLVDGNITISKVPKKVPC